MLERIIYSVNGALELGFSMTFVVVFVVGLHLVLDAFLSQNKKRHFSVAALSVTLALVFFSWSILGFALYFCLYVP